MKNIISGKMVLQRITNNFEKTSTDDFEHKNNYLNDLQKELGYDLNTKKTFKLKNIKEDKEDKEELCTNLNNKLNKDLKKETKRDIFFTNIKILLQEKKFINLKENKINTEINQSFKGKIEKNINIKYNYKILDLINYYDINYKIFKINYNERNNQDKFYNNIKYLNILEFYSINGCLSCLFNNKLENSDKHFIIENNQEYIKIIEDNKNTHNGFFHIININPININISDYLVNCIIFNNISDDNYTEIFNIINKNLKNLKNNIYDIYFEKLNNYDISPIYAILKSISFIKKLSENKREHWINTN